MYTTTFNQNMGLNTFDLKGCGFTVHRFQSLIFKIYHCKRNVWMSYVKTTEPRGCSDQFLQTYPEVDAWQISYTDESAAKTKKKRRDHIIIHFNHFDKTKISGNRQHVVYLMVTDTSQNAQNGIYKYTLVHPGYVQTIQ